MDESGIRLQERSTICDTEHVRAFALWRAFFGTLLSEQPQKTALEDKKHEKYTSGYL